MRMVEKPFVLLRVFGASWQPFWNYNEDSRELGFTKSRHTVKIQENGVRPQVFTVNLSSIVNRGKNSPLLCLGGAGGGSLRLRAQNRLKSYSYSKGWTKKNHP
jgi:hypothetical protein